MLLSMKGGLLALAFITCCPSGSPAQETKTTGKVSGRVLDALAQPIVTAEVVAATWLEPDVVLAKTRTDGAGFFVLGGVPFVSGLLLRASAPGRVTTIAYVSRSENSPEVISELRLWDAGRVRVRVVDADGEPLAGSLISASYDSSRRFGFDPQAEAVADGEGTATLTGVPLGWIHVRAWAPGHVMGQHDLWLRNEADVELRLERGTSVRIQVNVTGVPKQSGPRVRLLAYSPYRSQALPSPLVGGVLDERGQWSTTGLPPLEYVVSVLAEDLFFAPHETRVPAGSGDRILEFEAGRPAATVLRGVLRDAEGRPLPGETLKSRAAAGGLVRTQAVTDAEGRFTLDSPVAPGMKAIVYLVTSRHVLSQENERGIRQRHEFVVDPEQDLGLTAVPAAEVRGVLVDPRGGPVPFHRVSLQERRGDRSPEWMAFRHATTARDGTFAFSGLLPPQDRELRVGAGDTGASVSAALELEVGEKMGDLRIVLATPAVVEGTVSDRHGHPVAGARVWLLDWNKERGQQASGSVIEVLADRKGRYRFVDVAPGAHYLQVMHDVHELVRTGAFEVAPGGVEKRDLAIR